MKICTGFTNGFNNNVVLANGLKLFICALLLFDQDGSLDVSYTIVAYQVELAICCLTQRASATLLNGPIYGFDAHTSRRILPIRDLTKGADCSPSACICGCLPGLILPRHCLYPIIINQVVSIASSGQFKLYDEKDILHSRSNCLQ